MSIEINLKNLEIHGRLKKFRSSIMLAMFQRAIQLFTRLNALQFTRYTLVIEPLVALMYTLRTYFSTGTKTLTDPKLSDFFSRTQEQMQTFVVFVFIFINIFGLALTEIGRIDIPSHYFPKYLTILYFLNLSGCDL